MRPLESDSGFDPAVMSPILRRPIREELPDDLWIAFDGQQQRASWRVWGAAVLLPITQSRDRQVEGFSKFRLRHSETLSQHLDAGYAAHSRQLLGGERLRVRVRQCGSHDLVFGHRVEPRPRVDAQTYFRRGGISRE